MALLDTTQAELIDIVAYKGDTFFSDTIIFKDADDNFEDLTDYEFKMQVRDSLGTLYLDLSVGSGIVINNALGGEFYILVAKELMGFNAGEYKYDLQTTTPAGVRKTRMYGKFTLKTEITR